MNHKTIHGPFRLYVNGILQVGYNNEPYIINYCHLYIENSKPTSIIFGDSPRDEYGIKTFFQNDFYIECKISEHTYNNYRLEYVNKYLYSNEELFDIMHGNF